MEGFSPYLDKQYEPLLAGSIDGTDEYPHDRAIARAISAKYKPNKQVKGDPKLTLFVARLSQKTEEETLYTAFRQFGKIQHYRLVRDIVTGFSKCYGFVEFEHEKAVRRAYLEGKNMTIDEKEILVDYEHERTLKNWKPRRLGGGFGGRKESGQLRFGGRDRPFRKPLMAGSAKSADAQDVSRSSDSLRNYRSTDRGWRDRKPQNYESERSRRDYDSDRSRRDYDSDRSRRDYDSDRSRRDHDSDRSRHRYRSRSPDRDRYSRR